ncbi:putative bifunctional signaling protein/50S ribosomal protein L9 [Mycoplasmopsis maculosa]|uniref:Putative bifunctional signaling protein/50S ribosomal protein L9 n=1 Tax=Mycoplasmopsis maculosa TaxID=114885 RepID=A0A449B5B9_9BACT|nr:DHH family phosphoesterase [Mycoplasmopsis maculosa]VEU75782.1 putative bifunctional signaling protein/50S ribosomal protein L9 [Mycoplasmopsis maculosa]
MKFNKKIFLYILFSSLTFLLILGSILSFVFLSETKYWVLTIIGITFSVLILGIIGILISYKYAYKNTIVKKSFNHFVDEVISHNSLGVIIYDNDYKILWVSTFINNHFGKKWIGSSLIDFFNKYNIDFKPTTNKIQFNNNDIYYDANIWTIQNCLTIRDISIQKNIEDIYDAELSVIGEIEFDNYQLYQSILSEEDIYKINKVFINILDSLVQKYNLIYRQYTNGKFFVFTNKESLKKMEETNFSFLKPLHKALEQSKQSNIIISVSAGFATGYRKLWEKMENAKSALLQAQSRGGDQVVIVSNTSKPMYYGSSSEILHDISRTKIKSITHSIESRLKDPKITKVICYGHTNADLDAVGASLGIVAIAKTYGKEAYICSTTQDDTTKKSIKQLFSNADDLFIKPQQANKLTDENTLVFLLDIADFRRTDNPECISNARTNNIFIIDHHRLSTNVDFSPKLNRYIDSSTSSASEIVTEIIMFANQKVDLNIQTAQMLLNGIYLDTLQFTKHVNSRTFQAASWLEEKGANSSLSSEALKIDKETQEKVDELLKNMYEVKEGYFLASKDISLSNDVISVAAEQILRISGRKAAFVVAKLENTNTYKLSARGINVNVQLIAEEVGGGGHYSTSAATSSESFDVFKDNIIQAIVSAKDESNINKRF